MSIKYFCVVLYSLFFLFSCSRLTMPVGDTSIAVAAERLIESRPDIVHEPKTHRIASKTITQLLSYIQAKYGKNVRERLTGEWMTDRDYCKTIRREFGKTVYQFGIEMFADLEGISEGKAGAPMLATNFSVFTVHYPVASPAQADIREIASLLEQMYCALSNAFLKDTETIARFSLALGQLESKCFDVYLFETLDQAKKLFPDYNTTGLTSLDFYTNRIMFYNDNEFFKIGDPLKIAVLYKSFKIVLRYHNLAVSSVLTHEFVHTFQFMLEMPFTNVTVRTIDDFGSEYQREIGLMMRRWRNFASERFFGEGFAEMYAAENDFLTRMGFLSDVDRELNFLLRRGIALPVIRDLMAKGLLTGVNIFSGISQRSVNYQCAHSFTRFMVRRYGIDAVNRYVDSERTPEDFILIFTKDVDTLNAEWLTEVRKATE